MQIAIPKIDRDVFRFICAYIASGRLQFCKELVRGAFGILFFPKASSARHNRGRKGSALRIIVNVGVAIFRGAALSGGVDISRGEDIDVQLSCLVAYIICERRKCVGIVILQCAYANYLGAASGIGFVTRSFVPCGGHNDDSGVISGFACTIEVSCNAFPAFLQISKSIGERVICIGTDGHVDDVDSLGNGIKDCLIDRSKGEIDLQGKNVCVWSDANAANVIHWSGGGSGCVGSVRGPTSVCRIFFVDFPIFGNARWIVGVFLVIDLFCRLAVIVIAR